VNHNVKDIVSSLIANFSALTDGIQISLKKFLSIVLLFSTTLSWFYIFNEYVLGSILFKNLGTIWVTLGNLLFFVFIVASGLIGSSIIEKVGRRRLMLFWVAFGLVTTALVFFAHELWFILLLSALLGVAFGLGFPTCQAFLTESTTDEERGRVAGVAILVSFLIVVVVVSLADAIGVLALVVLALALKGSNLVTLAIDKCEQKAGLPLSWRGVLGKRSFILFAIPWFVFQITNGLALFGKVPDEFASVALVSQEVQFVGTIVTLPIAGLLADRLGRRNLIIGGLLMLGVSYVVFGVVNTLAMYTIYSIISGVAWGLMAVGYMIVILGDISSKYNPKEKFYALGGILIPLLIFPIFLAIQQLSHIQVPLNSLSSVLSIVIFLSIIPALRAPETLSENKIHDRRLQEHLKKVEDLLKESEE
jgi:MFS transporter, ACDE family, multidrug resistance protein